MKKSVFVFFLIVVLAAFALAGCQTVQAAQEPIPAAAAPTEPPKADIIPTEAPKADITSTEAPKAAPAAETPLPAPAEPAIAREEAEKIALDHAGFAADQVKRLRTEYEIARGIPHYDVEFDEGRWEYDYEIDAVTGEILSFEKDD